MYDLSGTPTWQKIANGDCIKTSCDDYVSERGLCYTHEDSCHVPACDDDVYRTDDGDGYCGAIASQLYSGESIADALRFACAAGALATSRQGAVPSLPFRRSILALIKSQPND